MGSYFGSRPRKKTTSAVKNTVSMASEAIGKTGLLAIHADGLQVPIVVKDVRWSYGRKLFLVVPDDTRPTLGESWVYSDRVTMDL